MVIMLVLAVAAVAIGWIQGKGAGRVNLGPWLTFEVMGRAAASVIGGVVSRRVAGRYRAPVVLAGTVFAIGLVEAKAFFRDPDGNLLALMRGVRP